MEHDRGRGAVKFAPAAVAPLFATAPARRRLRSSVLYAATFAAVTLALFLPFIPDGGIRDSTNAPSGFSGRRPGRSVWALSSHLHPAQAAVRAAAVTLSVLVAVVPARKTAEQLAALAAGVLVSFQLGLSYWIPSYVVWFAPFAFLALFLPYAAADEQAPAHDGQAARSGSPRIAHGRATLESHARKHRRNPHQSTSVRSTRPLPASVCFGVRRADETEPGPRPRWLRVRRLG